jgi:GAF domain-containing protein
MSDSPLATSLAALSRFFVGRDTLSDTLARISQLTVEAIEPVDLVGLTVPGAGRPVTAVFTDVASPEIDQAQYESGEGPCLDALRERQVFAVESTREEGRWPAFRRAAAAHGILSTLALPMIVDDESVGAMNLYSRRERAFPDADREDAELFCGQAAIAVANAKAYWDAHELSVHLGEAMSSRAVIEQAKGVLMAGQRCRPDEAFDLLRRASQRENVKLREIARRIVDNVSEPTADEAAS